jgi:hypothetical protein
MLASRAVSPRVVDDLTRILGIGPATTMRLQNAGIYTFAQLATLSAEGIASLIPRVSKEQVANQRWIEQAHALASHKPDARTPEKESLLAASRQHYENFTFEFLLGEKNRLRRLQVVHIQSGDTDTWTKWDTDRLIDFLSRHAETHLPHTKSIPQSTKKSRPSSMTKAQPAVPANDQLDEPACPGIAQLTTTDSQPGQPSAPTVSTGWASPARSTSITNRIHLLEWKTLLSDSRTIIQNIPHDRCFDVDITLDLTNAALPLAVQLDCSALLYARKLSSASRQVIGALQTTIRSASAIDLSISHLSLAYGLYRLEAFLTLVPAALPLTDRSAITTTFQGGLFQVY